MKIPKKRNINFSLILGVILIFSACSQQANKDDSKDQAAEKPNVVFILVDDMGYGDLSCFGQQTLKTPSIDKMSKEGMVFTSHYTGSTVCAPSRASLLTGKHTGHTNVRGNMPAQLLSDDETTIAKVMKKAGYVTGAVGKWGVGHPPPVDDPKRKGFDHFFGYVNMWHAHNFYPEFLYRNGKKVNLKNKLRLNPDGTNPWADMPEGTGVAEVREEYVHNLFDREALWFIEKNKDNPFFLYLAYNVPHANNEDHKTGCEVPDYGEYANKDWPAVEKGFASMITNLDNSVGMVMDKLKELGIDDNTMVVFCSDNGPHQEGGHKMEFFDSNGSLRGMKRDFYDGGVRTPFIVRWPEKVKAGTQSEHLSAFWDVLPTFCDIAGVEKPKDTDGLSFLPTLTGKGTQEQHDYLYWEFFEHGGKQAILKDNWKAVKLNVRDKSKPVVLELYNLKEDPAEINNVADQNPELVKEMEVLFKGARTDFSVVSLFSEDKKEVETPF